MRGDHREIEPIAVSLPMHKPVIMAGEEIRARRRRQGSRLNKRRLMPAAASPVRLREILAGDRCITAASLFDPMSARIADDIGFEVGVIGGSVASMAVLGDPDLILLTLSELAEQAPRAEPASSASSSTPTTATATR